MEITLTSMEMLIATSLGTARHMQSVKRTPSRGQPKSASLESHIMGAIGEIAAAKAIGIYPGFTVNNFDGADLGDDIQVRACREGRLIVADKDRGDHKYVLVVGHPPEMNVVGWMWGSDAKRSEWLFDPKNNRPPAYFVPHEKLHPIKSIQSKAHDIISAPNMGKEARVSYL